MNFVTKSFVANEEPTQRPNPDSWNQVEHLDNLRALRAFAWAAIATVIFWVMVGLYVAMQLL